ncbi:MAG: hypothetical protein ABFS32_04885 [Bacteroidota bacterium]
MNVSSGSIIEDTDIIAPSSISLADSTIESFSATMLTSKSFRVNFGKRDSIKVCYRVLPAGLDKKFSINSVGNYDSSAYFRPEKAKNNPLLVKREELFGLGEINQGGHISRGITVGNTQDLFVNSSLNLNLEGKLSNDINIRASITDQSLPYQPEGNTQQLQDFDNVFVELYNDQFSVTGGDIVLKNSDTYLLRYLKNVQGGRVIARTKNSTTTVGLSSAKGQFATTSIEVSEGVTGPYKISAHKSNGYVIIIANSEKVFLDGKQLVRGYNNDYVIDYNQAEITFTSNVIITNYSRVRVDYEYAVRNYARSIMNLNHIQKIGKASISVTYYKEADNPERQLFNHLSVSEKEILSSVGDNLDDAISLSAIQANYSPEKILYALRDTTDESGNLHHIYIHSTDINEPLYSVSFSEVDANKGDYNISEYAAQGRIYEWIGKDLGDYMPYKKLVAPGKKEMLDLRVDMEAGKYAGVYLESAFSNHDLNLFSAIGNSNNRGYALKGGYYINEKPLSILKSYKLQLSTDLEYLGANFNGIDRIRRVEFDRDWSYSPVDLPNDNDFVINTSAGLRKDANNGFLYQVNYRNKETQLKGIQHNLDLNKALGLMQVNVRGFRMKSTMINNQALWNKLYSEIYLKGFVQPGYRLLLEQNTVDNGLDSLISSANYFTSHEVFLRNSPEKNTLFELAYTTREDKSPVAGELANSGRSENIRSKLTTTIENNHRINVILNYRTFDNMVSTNDEAIESITGRIDWTGDIIKKVFRSELNYSISNARVPRREYIFIEVPTGEGTHTWRDENEDGVMDLNEFYEAIHFDERNYIKLYVNGTEFLDAYENIFNYRANIRAPGSWKDKGGLLTLLSRISNITSWTSHYRITDTNLAARFAPFLVDIEDNMVLSMKEALRSTLFINKANPKFGVNIGYANYRKKYLYTNGFESRSDEEYNFVARWNITKHYNLKLKSFSAQRKNKSDYLEGRNYEINDYSVGPSISWQPNPTFRITSNYFMRIKNSISSNEQNSEAIINEVLVEFKRGIATKYMLNGNVKYARINYNGNEQSPLGYEILQGMRPGSNMSWSLGWQQKLLNGLQVNLFYEGRKPQSLKVIHIGRISVSALF